MIYILSCFLLLIFQIIFRMKDIKLRQAHKVDEKERSNDIKIDENVSFSDMFLSDSVLSGLHSCGFFKPSPIQLAALPLGRCGLDLIVQAKSGTGKTLVFAVTTLEMICVTARTTQALIIAPTREIAVQICQVISSLALHMPDLRVNSFIGGMSVNEDKVKLKLCHIVVGTPGRLNQLISLGALNVTNVRLLVFDEADQLFSRQFKGDILNLVRTLPHNKQVLALSATYSSEITEILDKFMRSPSHVRLGREAPALLGVYQYVRLLPYTLQAHQKYQMKFKELLSIISTISFDQCLIFSNSQLRAESISNQLKGAGWPSLFLTGSQLQEDRLKSFFALYSYKCRILVSTDLSARGLDSEHVNLVINLDVPFDQATYLHRVGRSGRFGSKGIAISLVCEGEEWEALKVVATLCNVQIKVLENDSSLNMNDYGSLNEVPHLSVNKCNEWFEKNKKNPMLKNKMRHLNISISRIESNGVSETHISSSKDVSGDENNEKNTSIRSKGAIIPDKSLVNEILQRNSRCNNVYDFTFNEIKEKLKNIKVCDSLCEIKSNNCLKQLPYKVDLDLINKYIEKSYENLPNLDSLKDMHINSPDKVNSLSENDENTKLKKSGSRNLISSDCRFRNETSVESIHTMDLQKIDRVTPLDKPFSDDILNNDKLIRECSGINDEVDDKINQECFDSRSLETSKNCEKASKAKLFSINTGYGEWTRIVDNPNTVKSEVESKSLMTDVVLADGSETLNQSCNDNYYYFNDLVQDCGSSSSSSDEYDESSSDSSSYDEEYEYSSDTSFSDSDYEVFSEETNRYLKSAKKFVEMFQYVRNAGRISFNTAKIYHASFHS